MKIVAHRGYWLDPKEKNSLEAFKRALSFGFGIETDVRDFCGDLVISHDPPKGDCILYRDFIALANQYPEAEIAMNIKADGLQNYLKNSSFPSLSNIYYFDMSVPDMLLYSREAMPFYTRYSEFEGYPRLLEMAEGVWLDNFTDEKLDIKALFKFLSIGKKVTLVSPELHGYGYKQYWSQLRDLLQKDVNHSPNISLCTDVPTQAKEFFE